MDHRFRPPANSAARIRDLYWDEREGWGTAGGFRQITNDYDDGEGNEAANGFDGSAEVMSLHWFAQHNGGRQWLIWETTGGDLVYFNGSGAPQNPWTDLRDVEGNPWDGSSRSRTNVVSPWMRTQSAAWGDRIYLINGYNEPICFDGVKTERAGFGSAAPAPVAAAYDGSAGTEPPTTTLPSLGLGQYSKRCGYRWKCSFLNERGQESPLSEASEIVSFTNSAGARFSVTVDLPIGGPHVKARRLYRTQNIVDPTTEEPITRGGGENFFFVMEIQDNSTTLVQDAIPDAGLQDAVDELDFGPWPTSAKLLAPFKNTMFIAGMTNNTVAFSASGYPEVFPADNVIQVGETDSGPITGMYPTKNALVVFKARSVYLIKGDPSNGFYGETLSRDIGCSSPRTIRELPGLGVIFVSESGIHLLKGALTSADTTSIEPQSTPISDWVDRFNTSAMLNACAEVYHRDREYWLAVPMLGEINPTTVLVFHYEIGAWSYRENYPISCMVESHDHRGYIFFGSHDTSSSPGIHVYSRGWPDKDGVNDIEPLYEGAPIDFGTLYQSVSIMGAQFSVLGYGSNTMAVDFIGNRNMVTAYQLDPRDSPPTEPMQYPFDPASEDSSGNLTLPLYGTVEWGDAATWGEHRAVVLRVDMSSIHIPPIHELQIKVTSNGHRFMLCGYELDVLTGTAVPPTKTLTSAFGGAGR